MLDNTDFTMKHYKDDWDSPLASVSKVADSSDDWISLFGGQSLLEDFQSLESGFTNLDQSLLQEFCCVDEHFNGKPLDGSLMSLPSSYSTLTDKRGSSSSPIVAAVAGSAQSSIESISSQQDLWRDEVIDAMVFVDQTLRRDSAELKEEIATSTLNTCSEKIEIQNSEHHSNASIERTDFGTVSRNKESELKSDSSCGMESTKPEALTAETTPKKKRMRKRKSLHAASEDQQSDQSDTGKKSDNGELEEDGEKRQARLMRNRESAQLSRQRKKVYVTELEEKLRTMTSTVAELNNTIGLITAENVSLRSQLAYLYQANGLFPKPGALPAGFPAVPVPSYAGSTGGMQYFPGLRAPSVPIPRLKTHAPPKSSKSSKSATSKDTTGGQRKRLVGVAAMSFCLIMVIFAPLNSNFLGGDSQRTGSRLQNTRDQVMKIGGRILMSVDQDESPPNSSHGKWAHGVPWDMDQGKILGPAKLEVDSRDESSNRARGGHSNMQGSMYAQNPVDCCSLVEQYRNDSAVYLHNKMLDSNVTGALAATLFVPRNDKLIRIDGSLIIQAVMAGDEAAKSMKKEESRREANSNSGRGHLAGGQNLPVVANVNALEAVSGTAFESSGSEGSRLHNGLALEKQKPFSSQRKIPYDGSSMSDAENSGFRQQWLLSDFAGTILSTSTCTEVFHFEISPVPGMSKTNETKDVPSRKKPHIGNSLRTRRGLGGSVPLPPARHSTVSKNAVGTLQEEKPQESTKREYRQQEHQNERSRASSMVVSVLAESHQFEDGGTRTSGGSKSTSNFFVVILIDGVKYVTYSCMLPTQGPQPQLVTG